MFEIFQTCLNMNTSLEMFKIYFKDEINYDIINVIENIFK